MKIFGARYGCCDSDGHSGHAIQRGYSPICAVRLPSGMALLVIVI
jgi:hypothetical protein